MKRIYQILFIVLFFAAGIFLGWRLSSSSKNRTAETVSAEAKIWTCS